MSDSRQPVRLDAQVEGVDQRDPRLERKALAVEPVLVDGARERLGEHGPPLGAHPRHALADVGPVPAQRLQLEPDLRVAGGQVLLQVAHRRPPLLDEGHVARVHRPLARDQPLGEPLEHAHEQVLHRAEVVVHEPVVRARLLGQAPGADPGVADLDEQALRGVQERLLGLGPRSGLRRDAHARRRLRSACVSRTRNTSRVADSSPLPSAAARTTCSPA